MIIAVVNIKGGVGKTTTAMALATAAMQAGQEAVVYDADPQSSASLWAYAAEQEGDPLEFDVGSANIATVRRLKHDDVVRIIDCPPTGSVTDAAVSAADFVVVPTMASSMDMQQTWQTVAALNEQAKIHAILVTQAHPRTLSYKGLIHELEKSGASSFDTVIPQREALKNSFGHRMGELCGYEDVWAEIEGAME